MICGVRDENAEHTNKADALQRATKAEVDRVVMREGGAPYPYTAQRRGAQNALLVLGWDTASERVSAGNEGHFDATAWGLALAATRDTNSPAYQGRARAAMIEVMALDALVSSQPRGKTGGAP